jgi:hypothetical protein
MNIKKNLKKESNTNKKCVINTKHKETKYWFKEVCVKKTACKKF